MKEEHIVKAAEVARTKYVVLNALEQVKEKVPSSTIMISAENVFAGCYVSTSRLVTFLQGELQHLNLQLHNLGVELPGVPTIGGAQPVTKGNDI